MLFMGASQVERCRCRPNLTPSTTHPPRPPRADQREWQNISYCLSILGYNEKSLRKLIDSFENYREKLSHPYINECFKQVLMKVRTSSRWGIASTGS